VAAACGLALFGGAVPARAASVEVGTSHEAWYARVPSVESRPAGTLHVGVLLGVEESRTYLALDLTGVDASAVTGGTLRLPIDAASSRSLEQAAVDVCVAANTGPEVEGSSEDPPAADCSAAVPAVLDGDVQELVADLAPLAKGLGTTGLALVPRGGAAPAAVWHVTIRGRANTAPGARPIRATLDLAGSGPDAPARPGAKETDVTPRLPAAPSPVFADEDDAFASVTAFEVPPAVLSGAAAPLVALAGGDAAVPNVGARPAAARPPVRVGASPPNSVAFAMPLVVLAVACYLGSALTRPAAPARGPGRDEPRRAPRPGAGARAPSTGE
jgi:hypothetical protein